MTKCLRHSFLQQNGFIHLAIKNLFSDTNDRQPCLNMSDEDMSPAERPYNDILNRQIDEGATQAARTARGLSLSSLAAGLFIGFGPLLMAVAHTIAADVYSEPTIRLLISFMYSVGFIFVVISETDLYTELDTRAAFPVFQGQTPVSGLGRLYAFTIVFNVIGGIIASLVMVYIGTTYGFVEPTAFEHLATVYTERSTWQLFLGSILAGWLMGLLAWLTIAANGVGSRTFFVILVTAAIAFMHLPHSIAGNVEVFMGLLVDSPVTWFDWGRFLVASVIGNAIGGVVFVAVTAYGGRQRNDD